MTYSVNFSLFFTLSDVYLTYTIKIYFILFTLYPSSLPLNHSFLTLFSKYNQFFKNNLV